MNRPGAPLRSFDLVERYIAGTAAASRLTVTAQLKRGSNKTGDTASDDEMAELLLTCRSVCPEWSYTLTAPRKRRNWRNNSVPSS